MIQWFRFAGAPQKIDFLLDGMNIVDLLAVLPFYVSLFLAPPTTPLLPYDELSTTRSNDDFLSTTVSSTTAKVF
jgi:hypothetical protein